MSNAFWNNPVIHAVLTVVLFVLPTILAAGGSWQSLTLGGILVAVLKSLQNKANGLTLGGSHMV